MGAKIVVVRLRTIIKYALCIAAAAAVIITLINIFGSDDKRTAYIPGTYSAEIVLHSHPVSVQVTVDKHSITDVSMVDMGDTEAVFYPVFEQSFDDIAQQIITLQSTEDVQLTDDNTITGGIILDAVDMALKKAVK